ncbi:hypothetical protein ACFLY6_02745 [Candidatus Dependentiae bacterium]
MQKHLAIVTLISMAFAYQNNATTIEKKPETATFEQFCKGSLCIKIIENFDIAIEIYFSETSSQLKPGHYCLSETTNTIFIRGADGHLIALTQDGLVLNITQNTHLKTLTPNEVLELEKKLPLKLIAQRRRKRMKSPQTQKDLEIENLWQAHMKEIMDSECPVCLEKISGTTGQEVTVYKCNGFAEHYVCGACSEEIKRHNGGHWKCPLCRCKTWCSGTFRTKVYS